MKNEEIIYVSSKDKFDIEFDTSIPAFAAKSEFVPEIDETYCFDSDTTQAILAGFKHNKKVLIQGFHGTGKSSHIEQIAARLNWPTIRVNLDGYISRIDFIGRDVIKLKDGLQITEFQEGLLPWALKQPMCLILDEYDAGRPDVMFVLQRLLEENGKFTLLDRNEVITPHKYFRVFATMNTVGFGDTSGLYHGTYAINQGQMDRWNIVTTLNYISPENELKILQKKFPHLKDENEIKVAKLMIEMANLTRNGLMSNDISSCMSPRTVINWVENNNIFKGLEKSFKVTFLNKCDEAERPIIAEYYQRVFGVELEESLLNNQEK